VTTEVSAAGARSTASASASGAGFSGGDPARRRSTSWRLYAALAIGSLLIGSLSLLYPSTPSYDPWGWLLWGREIIHLKLDTVGYNSFKPLPVLFTVPFALFGRAQPDLWLVVARTGAVFTIAMAFKLAARITMWFGATPAGRRGVARLIAYGPAILAGSVAALAVLISSQYVRDAMLGYSECLGAGMVLLAIDRHLDDKPRQAFAIGFIPALDRPEIWAFWGLYGLYLWRRDHGAWKLIAALFVLVPCLWFLPSLWGSGHLLSGVTRALHPRKNSAAFAKCPFCTEMKAAWQLTLSRDKVVAGLMALGAAIAVGMALRGRTTSVRSAVRAQAHRPAGVVLALAVMAIIWFVEISGMTQYGFSGNQRYLIVGGALVVVIGGVGWGLAAWKLGQLLARWIHPATGAAIAIGAATVVFLLVPGWVGSRFSIGKLNQAMRYQAELREDLSTIIERAGGAKKINACGKVQTEDFQKPMVAWYLGLKAVEANDSGSNRRWRASKAPNVILQTRDTGTAGLRPFLPTSVHYTKLRQRTFTLYEHCK
jgi:hypothetical protein